MTFGYDEPSSAAPIRPIAHRILWILTWILFAAGMLGWFVLGANRPPDPELIGSTAGASAVARVPVAGFGTVAFTVAGDSQTRCALEAANDAARAQGMQRRTDLGGFDAMVFRFEADSTTPFVNHNVPIDLSIGWYDAAGRLVDTKEMAACPTGRNCPLYAAARPYRTAIETPAGGLAQLGLTASGAQVTLGGTCA